MHRALKTRKIYSQFLYSTGLITYLLGFNTSTMLIFRSSNTERDSIYPRKPTDASKDPRCLLREQYLVQEEERKYAQKQRPQSFHLSCKIDSLSSTDE